MVRMLLSDVVSSKLSIISHLYSPLASVPRSSEKDLSVELVLLKVSFDTASFPLYQVSLKDLFMSRLVTWHSNLSYVEFLKVTVRSVEAKM